MESPFLKGLLYFLIISLPAGAFMFHFKLFFFEMYGFRIAIISSLLFFVFSKKLVLYRNELTKKVSLFFLLWITYSFLSMAWAPDKFAAFIETSYIIFGALVYVVFLSFKTHYSTFEKELNNVWIITLSIVFIASGWEIVTERHLVSNYTVMLSQLGIFHNLHSTPVFTFDNLNHYAIYISISLIFLLTQLFKNNDKLLRGILISIAFYFFVLFQSRFGQLFFWISIFIFFFSNLKSYFITREHRGKIVTVLAIAGVLLLGIFAFNDTIRVHGDLKKEFLASSTTEKRKQQLKQMEGVTISPVSTKTKEAPLPIEHSENTDSVSANQQVDTSEIVLSQAEHADTLSAASNEAQGLSHLNSNQVRKNLILNGFYFFKRSHFLGVGAGGFEVMMAKGENRYDTSGIVDPHNYFIEIIAQYGLIIALLFAIIFFYTIKILALSIKQIGFNPSHFFLVLSLICYAIMSNANSSFLPLPLNWFLFALIMIQTDDLLTMKQHD